ncbi:hypothetical protein FRB97_002278 [Tulasnella sp. 331]|nr:hypothetical protein FRB97_002278 [Tulasnella sp. 331]
MEDALLIGYGAIGVVYSYIIQQSGRARLTVVARSNFDAAKQGGIVLNSGQFGKITDFRPHRVLSSVGEAADRAYKYVFIATKALPDVLPTSKILEPLLALSYEFPQPTYVLLQNGLGVENDLYKKLLERDGSTPPQIITCAVNCISMTVGNVVEHKARTTLEAGLYIPHGSVTSLDRTIPANVEAFRSLMEAGGGDIRLVENVQAAKFKKNLWNIMFTTFSCLTRVPLAFYVKTPDLWDDKVMPLLLETGTEVAAVGRALRFSEADFPSNVAEETIAFSVETMKDWDINSNHKVSTHLDIEAGKPFEVEVIVGEVVRLGKALRVSIPSWTTGIRIQQSDPPGALHVMEIEIEIMKRCYGAIGVVCEYSKIQTEFASDAGVIAESYIIQQSGRARLTVVARSEFDAAGALDANLYALPDVLPASKILQPLLAISYEYPQPTYVLVQNGLGIQNDLYMRLLERDGSPAPQIVTCAVHCITMMIGNIVEQKAHVRKPQTLLEAGLYMPDGCVMTLAAAVPANFEEFRILMEAGGGDIKLVGNAQATKFRKNLLQVLSAHFSPYWLL